MSDAKFVPGLFFKDKHENAPDFVVCKGSIKVADMASFLASRDDEWINFDLKRSRDGRLYAAVDDWKPDANRGGSSGSRGGAPQRQRPSRATDGPADDFADDPIPFIRSNSRW